MTRKGGDERRNDLMKESNRGESVQKMKKVIDVESKATETEQWRKWKRKRRIKSVQCGLSPLCNHSSICENVWGKRNTKVIKRERKQQNGKLKSQDKKPRYKYKKGTREGLLVWAGQRQRPKQSHRYSLFYQQTSVYFVSTPFNKYKIQTSFIFINNNDRKLHKILLNSKQK